jgi:hypothetical protein
MHYEAHAEIAAPPERIWSILTDAPGMASWDSGIERVEGRIARGERITLYSRVSPGRPFKLTVAEFEVPRRMVWRGGMPLGLFTGVRTYTLTPNGPLTSFHMREQFGGLMLPLIRRGMPDLGPSFEQFARGLKAAAEA